MESNLTIEYKPKSFPEISNQYLNSKKIMKDIGWKSKTSMGLGLEKTINFYKEMS